MVGGDVRPSTILVPSLMHGEFCPFPTSCDIECSFSILKTVQSEKKHDMQTLVRTRHMYHFASMGLFQQHRPCDKQYRLSLLRALALLLGLLAQALMGFAVWDPLFYPPVWGLGVSRVWGTKRWARRELVAYSPLTSQPPIADPALYANQLYCQTLAMCTKSPSLSSGRGPSCRWHRDCGQGPRRRGPGGRGRTAQALQRPPNQKAFGVLGFLGGLHGLMMLWVRIGIGEGCMDTGVGVGSWIRAQGCCGCRRCWADGVAGRQSSDGPYTRYLSAKRVELWVGVPPIEVSLRILILRGQ